MRRNTDIKIAFIDIDNTILFHHNHHHDFDKISIRALNKLQKKYGFKLIIATGRPYDSAARIGTFNYINPDGVVSCNGANAIIGNKVIYSDAFSKETVRNVINICNELGLVVEVSTPMERYFTAEPNEYVFEYFKTFQETVPEIKQSFDDCNVNALLIFAPKELDSVLKERLGEDIDPARFGEYGIDVRTHNVKKSDGLAVILQYYGLTSEEAISFGDTRGDIPMFEISKIGVAIGNAYDECKEKADFVTKHIKNHGVKYALKHFHII